MNILDYTSWFRFEYSIFKDYFPTEFRDYKLILGSSLKNFESIIESGFLNTGLKIGKDSFSHKTNEYKRWQDTEFKLLEYVMTQIFAGKEDLIKLLIKTQNWSELHKHTQSISGEIEIFTERRVCESCASVIKLFKKILPNIKLTVIEGYGDHIEYRLNGIDLTQTHQEICNIRKRIAFGDNLAANKILALI
jgi:The  BURPS668_1122 family of deaminases